MRSSYILVHRDGAGRWVPAVTGTANQTGLSDREASIFPSRGEAEDGQATLADLGIEASIEEIEEPDSLDVRAWWLATKVWLLWDNGVDDDRRRRLWRDPAGVYAIETNGDTLWDPPWWQIVDMCPGASKALLGRCVGRYAVPNSTPLHK
jgi:hypothetical protein